MARTAALAGALVILVLLLILTVKVAVHDGIDVLVVASFVILALLGVGVLGALNVPPDE